MSHSTLLQRRHKRFQTAPETIFNLVARVTSHPPLGYQKIVKGYDSEVYLVQTDQQDFIVKIKRFGEVSFKQEAWAVNQCLAAGVPVPEILLLETVELPDGEHEIMIQPKLPGRPLDELKDNLQPDQLTYVLNQAGEILSQIHEIKVEGFYHRSESGQWDFDSWQSLTQSMYDDRSQERPLLLQAGLTAKQFDILIAAVKRYQTEFDCPQPVLCHSDFLPQHIFVDQQLKISGVIDFGEFQGNHPVADFAYIQFEAPWVDLDLLKQGYRNPAIFDQRFDLRLLLHQIPLQIDTHAPSLRSVAWYFIKIQASLVLNPAPVGT